MRNLGLGGSSTIRKCHNYRDQTMAPRGTDTRIHRHRHTHKRDNAIKVKQPVLSSSARFLFLFDLILDVPVNNFSVISGRVFLG